MLHILNQNPLKKGKKICIKYIFKTKNRNTTVFIKKICSPIKKIYNVYTPNCDENGSNIKTH